MSKEQERKPLWVSETRLQGIISGWFAAQNSGQLPKETLARRILDALDVMPDEFFEHVEKHR